MLVVGQLSRDSSGGSAACICVVYWRTALRVILIAVLALAVYGAVVGIHGVSSLMAAHHHQ